MKTGLNFQSFKIKRVEGRVGDRVDVVSRVITAIGFEIKLYKRCFIKHQETDYTWVRLITNDATEYLEKTIADETGSPELREFISNELLKPI